MLRAATAMNIGPVIHRASMFVCNSGDSKAVPVTAAVCFFGGA